MNTSSTENTGINFFENFEKLSWSKNCSFEIAKIMIDIKSKNEQKIIMLRGCDIHGSNQKDASDGCDNTTHLSINTVHNKSISPEKKSFVRENSKKGSNMNYEKEQYSITNSKLRDIAKLCGDEKSKWKYVNDNIDKIIKGLTEKPIEELNKKISDKSILVSSNYESEKSTSAKRFKAYHEKK